MSEQKNKPTNQSKSSQVSKGKNTFSEHVTLDNGEQKDKPISSTIRKKPSVSHATMHVDMPGVLRGSEEKKPPVTKPKPVDKRQSSAEMPPPKPKKPVTPAKRKTSPPVKGKAKVPSTKKRAAPTKRKPVARVVPPKIGSRRGYQPSLAFRLRFPVFLIAFIVCAFALFLSFRKGVGPVGRYVTSPMQSPFIELTIEPGMSARSVSLLLKEQGIVDDEVSLLQYFIRANIATTLRSGTFVMEKGMPYETLGKQLTAKPGELVLTVSPAFTLKAIDRYLYNRGYAKEGSFLASAAALKEEHSLSFAEGWLLSGEYVVSSEDAASALAQAMFDAMLAVVKPHLGSEQVAQWGLEQTLIVASMIQAETQNIEEMPLIASVIYNRLEAEEPLGIDATTRYEIDDWENPIPKRALEEKTPYNTRRKVGLPPSGICSPSIAAVEAALFPLESPYFYYLHGLDKRLYPAVTYEEHKLNIKAYR